MDSRSTSEPEAKRGGLFLRLLSVGLLLLSPLPASASVDWAVLVGVSKYEHLTIRPLEGPKNDIAAMRTFVRALGVTDGRVLVLDDDAKQESLLPRRHNILAALASVARQAMPGQTVLIYFSGHGGQVPQGKVLAPGVYREPDGLDEVFITRDTRLWNKALRRIEGALVDDEIGAALRQFNDKGVHAWAIFDTCHSGDMVRGGSGMPQGATARGLNAAELGVPDRALDAAARRAASMRRGSVEKRAFVDRMPTPRAKDAGVQPAGRLIAFYASYPDEQAIELPLTPFRTEHNQDAPSTPTTFGLFTWALTKQQSNLRHATFETLASAIRQEYQQTPKARTSPMFEGQLDRRLLVQ